jgi:hypothetical protein
MTKHITNNSGIPLVLAVWLVHDEYDYISAPNYISATALMKPLRQILLPQRIPVEERTPEDVEDYISRGLGNSIHDSVEKAWSNGNHRVNLRKLGYPEDVIRRVLVNPEDHQLDAMIAAGEEPIPVYIEQRMFRAHQGMVIGGKYDNLTDGIVNDTKSTSAYAWVYGGRDGDYRLQGSLYRWIDAQGHSSEDLDPDSRFRPRITEDYMRVNFVFTDWQKVQANSNPGYPQKRTLDKEISLLPLDETEAWINDKLRLIEKFKDVPEADMPECTPEELWQSDPKYKFYKDPAKANKAGARSTKNFDDLMDARRFQAEKHGGAGIIKTIPGEPKRCGFCPAYEICGQRKRLGV